MHHLNVDALSGESPSYLHQTTGVRRDNSINPRVFNCFDFLVQNRHRNLRVFDRKGASETATGVRIFQLNKLRITHAANQTSWFGVNVKVAQRATGVVPCDATIKPGPDILNLKDSDKE